MRQRTCGVGKRLRAGAAGFLQGGRGAGGGGGGEAPPGGGGGGRPGRGGGGGRAPVPPRASGRVWGAALLAGAVVAAAGYVLMPFKGAPDLQVEGAPEPAAAAERAIGDSA